MIDADSGRANMEAMISSSDGQKGARGRRSANMYELRVTLPESEPEIWRRIHVPAKANLGWLHAVLQVAIGWTNSHLHMFNHFGQIISDPAFEMDEFEGDPPVADEAKIRINQLLSKPGDNLLYEYDFGDSWVHVVMLERIRQSSEAEKGKAVCVAGARACPPEDCGGLGGYYELLKVMKKPKHPEHKSTKELLGRPFKPGHFSIDEVNPWLAKLRWPRVTEAALRRVLMARDED
jgi:hypothetical protein